MSRSKTPPLRNPGPSDFAFGEQLETLRAKERELESSDQRLRELRQVVQGKNNETENMKQEISHLQNMLQQKQMTRKRYIALCESQKDEIERLEQALETQQKAYEEEHRQCTAHVSRVREEYAQIEGTHAEAISSLTVQKNALALVLDEKDREISLLKQKLEVLTQKRQKAYETERYMKELYAKERILSEEKATLDEQLGNVVRERRKAQVSIQDMQEKISAVRREQQSLSSEQSECLSRVESLERLLGESNECLSKTDEIRNQLDNLHKI
mmetsp:Transcript_9127/g.12248  ORF Transcript_9127/g.12248 Transcript_9127/m.12248 type:complete len:271 (-) Transcript_9127:24-836(-)